MAYSPMYINPATSNFANDWQNAAQVSQMMQENAANSNPEWGYWNAVVGNAFNMASAMPEGYTRRDYNEERAIAARQLTWGPLISGGGIMANAALTAAMYGNVQEFLVNTMPDSFTYSKIPLVGRIFRPSISGAIFNPGLTVGAGLLEGARLAENIAGFGTSFLGRNLGRGIGAATGGLIGGAAKTAAWGARLSAASLGFGAESTKWMTNWGISGTLARWGGTAGGIVGGFAANFLNPVFLAKNYLLERGIEYAQDAYDELNTQADLQKEMIAKGSRILRYGFSDGSRGLKGGFTTRQRDRFSSFIENLARSDERVARMDAFHMGSDSVFGGHHQYVENLKELKSLFSVATDTGMLDLSKSLDDVEKKFSELAKIVKKLNRVTGKSKGELAAAMASIQQSEARFNMLDVGRALERRSYAAMATGAQLGTAMMEGQMGAQLGMQFGVGKAIGADMATQSRLVIGRMIRGGALGREQLAAMGGEEGAITALTSGILGSMQDDTFMTEMAMSYNPNTGGFDDSRLNKYIGADAATLQRLHRERALALTTYSLNPFTGRMEAGGALKGLMPQVQYAMQTGQLSSAKALKWISNLTRQTIAMRGETFGRTSVINTLTERFGYATAMQLAPVILNGEYMDATPGEQAEVARLNALQRYDREITGRGMTAGAIGMFGGLWGILKDTPGIKVGAGVVGAGILGGIGKIGLRFGAEAAGVATGITALGGIAPIYAAARGIGASFSVGSSLAANGMSRLGTLLGLTGAAGSLGGLGLGGGIAALGLYGLGAAAYHGWGLLNVAAGSSHWKNYYRNKYNQGKADAWRQLYGLSDFAYEMMSNGGEEAINLLYSDPKGRLENWGFDQPELRKSLSDAYDRVSIANSKLILPGRWKTASLEPDNTFLSATTPERYYAGVARSLGKSWYDNSFSYRVGQMITSALFTETGSTIGKLLGSALGTPGQFVGSVAGGWLTTGLDIQRYNNAYYANNSNASTWEAMANNPYFINGSMARATLTAPVEALYLGASGLGKVRDLWSAIGGLRNLSNMGYDPLLHSWVPLNNLNRYNNSYFWRDYNNYNMLLASGMSQREAAALAQTNRTLSGKLGLYTQDVWSRRVVTPLRNLATSIGNQWDAAGNFLGRVGNAWETETIGEFFQHTRRWAGNQFDRYILDPITGVPRSLGEAIERRLHLTGEKGWFREFSGAAFTAEEMALMSNWANSRVAGFGSRMSRFAGSYRGIGTQIALDALTWGMDYIQEKMEASDNATTRAWAMLPQALGVGTNMASYALTGAWLGGKLGGVVGTFLGGPGGTVIGGAIGSTIGTIAGAGFGLYQKLSATPARSYTQTESWKSQIRIGTLAGYGDTIRASLVEMYGSAKASGMLKNHKLGKVTQQEVQAAVKQVMEANGWEDTLENRQKALETVNQNQRIYESDSYNERLNGKHEFLTGEWGGKDVNWGTSSPILTKLASYGGIGIAAWAAAAYFSAPITLTAAGAMLAYRFFGGTDTSGYTKNQGAKMDATRSLLLNNAGREGIGIFQRLMTGKLTDRDVQQLSAASAAAVGSKERSLLDTLIAFITEAGAGEFDARKVEDVIVKIGRITRGKKTLSNLEKASINSLLKSIDNNKGGIEAIQHVAELGGDYIKGLNLDYLKAGIRSLNLTNSGDYEGSHRELVDIIVGKKTDISSKLREKLKTLNISDFSESKIKDNIRLAVMAAGQKEAADKDKNSLESELTEDDPQKTIAKTQVEIAKYLKDAMLIMSRISSQLNINQGGIGSRPWTN